MSEKKNLRLKQALLFLLRERADIRHRLESKPTFTPSERIKERLERRVVNLSTAIDHIEDHLKVLEARGEAKMPESADGLPVVLTAEQRSDVARAELETVQIIDWYRRRSKAGNMPDDAFKRGMEGVECLRRCLDILLKMPVQASKSPGERAWDAARSAGSSQMIGGPTWEGLAPHLKELWNGIAEAARK